MSDRVFAIAWIAVSLLVAVQMYSLEVPFAYEPVGPKVFPFVLAVLMALCCLAMFVRPDPDVSWPSISVMSRSVVLLLSLLVYAIIFNSVGFPIATVAMTLVVSRLFGASWRAAAISAVLISAVGYIAFDRLLGVALPLGQLWR